MVVAAVVRIGAEALTAKEPSGDSPGGDHRVRSERAGATRERGGRHAGFQVRW